MRGRERPAAGVGICCSFDGSLKRRRLCLASTCCRCRGSCASGYGHFLLFLSGRQTSPVRYSAVRFRTARKRQSEALPSSMARGSCMITPVGTLCIAGWDGGPAQTCVLSLPSPWQAEQTAWSSSSQTMFSSENCVATQVNSRRRCWAWAHIPYATLRLLPFFELAARRSCVWGGGRGGGRADSPARRPSGRRVGCTPHGHTLRKRRWVGTGPHPRRHECRDGLRPAGAGEEGRQVKSTLTLTSTQLASSPRASCASCLVSPALRVRERVAGRTLAPLFSRQTARRVSLALSLCRPAMSSAGAAAKAASFCAENNFGAAAAELLKVIERTPAAAGAFCPCVELRSGGAADATRCAVQAPRCWWWPRRTRRIRTTSGAASAASPGTTRTLARRWRASYAAARS